MNCGVCRRNGTRDDQNAFIVVLSLADMGVSLYILVAFSTGRKPGEGIKEKGEKRCDVVILFFGCSSVIWEM